VGYMVHFHILAPRADLMRRVWWWSQKGPSNNAGSLWFGRSVACRANTGIIAMAKRVCVSPHYYPHSPDRALLLLDPMGSLEFDLFRILTSIKYEGNE
jgi:hypothetical protein